MPYTTTELRCIGNINYLKLGGVIGLRTRRENNPLRPIKQTTHSIITDKSNKSIIN